MIDFLLLIVWTLLILRWDLRFRDNGLLNLLDLLDGQPSYSRPSIHFIFSSDGASPPKLVLRGFAHATGVVFVLQLADIVIDFTSWIAVLSRGIGA